jgi:cytochrome c oxidase assembly protein subunit 15
MQTGAHTLGRVRELALSADAFRRIAIGNAAMLVVIVATGATVRLTGSGLGCHHWPGCAPNQPLPEQGFHSYVEFGNRVIAFITICVTLATWLASRFASMPTRVRRLALTTFVGTLLQAPLGAITVHYHLNPWLVLSHFLLSMVVLASGVMIALEAFPRARSDVPRYARWGGVFVGLAVTVLVISGTLATASGPYPGSFGSKPVSRVWAFQPAVYWHVRATAVFGISFALLLIWLTRHRSRHTRWALALLGVLAVQMTIGEVQYRTQLPWWLILAHVTVAATVFATAFGFVYRLWRPPATRIV